MDQQRSASKDLAALSGALTSRLSSGDGERSSHYAEIDANLRADAARPRTPAIDQARALSSRLAELLLDQAMLSSVQTVLAFLRYGLIAGVVFFGAATALQFGARGFHTPSAYGLFCFAAALAATLALSLAHTALAKAGRTRIRAVDDELVDLVRSATTGFQAKLIDLRSAMAASTANGVTTAVAAASDARLETIAALHFFDEAPIVSADGQGETCQALSGALKRAAAARMGRLSGFMATVGAGIGAAGLGAAILYMSAPARPPFPLPPELFAGLAAFESAAPGVMAIAVGLVAAIVIALISGRYIGVASAGARPERVLEAEPVRSIATRIYARAHGAAVERPREIVERYADALFGFERRMGEWTGGARQATTAPSAFGADAREEEPAWRRAPEGPRFVESRFAAAPRQWLAGPSGERVARPFASPDEGASAPKRTLFKRPGRAEP